LVASEELTGDFGSADGVVVVGVAGFSGVVVGVTGFGFTTGLTVEFVFVDEEVCEGVATGFFSSVFTAGVVGVMTVGFAFGTVGFEATVVVGFIAAGVEVATVAGLFTTGVGVVALGVEVATVAGLFITGVGVVALGVEVATVTGLFTTGVGVVALGVDVATVAGLFTTGVGVVALGVDVATVAGLFTTGVGVVADIVEFASTGVVGFGDATGDGVVTEGTVLLLLQAGNGVADASATLTSSEFPFFLIS
jgi:hypothetical protein